jgi:hypothetical protein
MVPISPRFMGTTSSPAFEVPVYCGGKHYLVARDGRRSSIYCQLT